jgi:hypothetical protein
MRKPRYLTRCLWCSAWLIDRKDIFCSEPCHQAAKQYTEKLHAMARVWAAPHKFQLQQRPNQRDHRGDRDAIVIAGLLGLRRDPVAQNMLRERFAEHQRTWSPKTSWSAQHPSHKPKSK